MPDRSKVAQLVSAVEVANDALKSEGWGFSVCVRRDADGRDYVPLKQAAATWGVCIGTAISRARRSGGVKQFGRWLVPVDLVSTAGSKRQN